MPTAFAEEADVRRALQKNNQQGSLASEFMQDAIHSASDWFARQTNGYWFDSGSNIQSDLIATSNESETGVILDVPSSPHAQDKGLVTGERGVRYPVSTVGPYAELPLPHLHVSAVDALNVRDSGGETEDWVAGSQTSGVGEDYYLQSAGQNSYGRTYLRVDVTSLPALFNYEGAITIDYSYGLDYATTPWDDVNRGIAQLAAAELVSEDSVLAQVPDQGQLVDVATQYDQLDTSAMRNLDEYRSAMGDNR